jgi:hypothetical protein
MAKVRLHLDISQELAEVLNNVAKSENITRSEIVRNAISLIETCREQRVKGKHLGFVQDASRLDTEISGLFGSMHDLGAAVGSSAAELVMPSEPQPILLEAVMSRWSRHLNIL